jgi:hypothetical protein
MHQHTFRFDLPNSAPYPATDSCACGVYRDYAPNHHAYRLVEIDGRLEKIDEGMVDLVEKLTSQGVRTGHCCQGGCVDFPQIYDYNNLTDTDREYLIEELNKATPHNGYVTFHREDEAIAMPIISKMVEIVDIQPSVTWRKSFDGKAISVHFKGMTPCDGCMMILNSYR